MKQKLTIIIAITSVFIITCYVSLNAQVKKKDWLVTGNIGNISTYNYSHEYIQNGKSQKSVDQGYFFGFSPGGGYFISDNLVIGSQSMFTVFASKSKGFPISYYSIRLALTPYLRYYFGNANLKNRLYSQLGGGMGIELSHSKNNIYNSSGKIISTNISNEKRPVVLGEALMGINHFFTNTVAFDSSIGYRFEKVTRNETDIRRTGYLSWNIGFEIFFPKNNK